MSDNMLIYKAVRSCPQEALKPITGGRLNGKSDINPMWRIKALTEQFGPCGIGWYYDVTRQWLERGEGDTVAAFCNISLYIKWGDEWSKPIQGTGGSAFVAKERGGLYTSDECFKMALTDAISVACKALGFAADVYWSADRTKYDTQPVDTVPPVKISKPTAETIEGLIAQTNSDKMAFLDYFGVANVSDMNRGQAEKAMKMLKIKMKE